MLLAVLLGWLEREQCDVIAFLREENRALKAQLFMGALGTERTILLWPAQGASRDLRWPSDLAGLASRPNAPAIAVADVTSARDPALRSRTTENRSFIGLFIATLQRDAELCAYRPAARVAEESNDTAFRCPSVISRVAPRVSRVRTGWAHVVGASQIHPRKH